MKTASRLTTCFLPDGAYRFADELTMAATATAGVFTCTGWLLELYRLRSGEVFFERGEAEVRPTGRRFGVWFPPFAVTRAHFNAAHGNVVGLASTAPLPQDAADTPIMFDTQFTDITGAADVFEILRTRKNTQSVDLNPGASALSKRARKLIAAGHLGSVPLSAVAARLDVTPAHLARQFKRDFGITPREYLHRLRMADAPLKLARGEPIASISSDVGYHDLSRFYRQFRKATQTSPGVCQTMIAPRRARRPR